MKLVFSILAILSSFWFVQCQSTQLRGGQVPTRVKPEPKPEPETEKPREPVVKKQEPKTELPPLSLAITCANEKTGKLKVPGKFFDRKVKFELASNCFKSDELEGGFDEKKLAVILSLDVSTSMVMTLDIIKENIIALVEKLQKNGYNLQIGAVGFVDFVLDGRFGTPKFFIKPTDAESFKTEISNWQVQNLSNRDMQEAGFEGISEAIKLSNWAKDRDQLAILHITDALSFAGEDHEDFSVTTIADQLSVFRNAASFQFFYSAPKTLGDLGFADNVEKAAISPADQLESMTKAAFVQNKSKPLAFPFTEETLLNDFANGLIKLPSKKIELKCGLRNAVLIDEKGDTIADLLKEDTIDLEKSIEGMGTKTLNVSFKRCCKHDASFKCSTETSTVSFSKP